MSINKQHSLSLAEEKCHGGAHNRCWGYLRSAISAYGEAKRNFEFIGGDQDRQLKHLWAETGIGEILPWEDFEEEAEKFLESARAHKQASEDSLLSVRSRKMTEQ